MQGRRKQKIPEGKTGVFKNELSCEAVKNHVFCKYKKRRQVYLLI